MQPWTLSLYHIHHLSGFDVTASLIVMQIIHNSTCHSHYMNTQSLHIFQLVSLIYLLGLRNGHLQLNLLKTEVLSIPAITHDVNINIATTTVTPTKVIENLCYGL